MSVLQELPVLKGNVNVIGQVAYVSQQPWIFSGSLRQNITFGNEYIKAKYDKIIDGCALDSVSYIYMGPCTGFQFNFISEQR